MPVLRRPAEPDGSPRNRSAVRSALLRFTAWLVILTLALTVGSVYLGGRIAKGIALREAEDIGRRIAAGVAAPNVDAEVRAGSPEPVARLRSNMRGLMRDVQLSRIKIWAADGTVIWSDVPELIGEQFDLSPAVEDLFGTENVTSELSDLTRRENLRERNQGQLLEVYAGTTDADGVPMVVEAYLGTAQMAATERSIVQSILALSVGVVLLFMIAVLPLALSLARRVERKEAEHLKMFRHVQLATDLERRRIAQDLHDGVIQDLAGLSYALPVVHSRVVPGPEGEQAREAVDRMSGILHRDVAALRAILTDIYPPDLSGPRFREAVEELAGRVREHGIDVRLEIPSDHAEPVESSRLIYRIIREGLRNVVRHAHASSVVVAVNKSDGSLRVVVRDDGRGLGANNDPDSGHLGLRLLEDTLNDFGGGLSVHPDERRGTVLEAQFPVSLGQG